MEHVVKENYFLECLGMEPATPGWKVITNKGNKRLLHYHSQQQLALSHGWREYLAEKGYRCVERFLVTRDGTRWVEKEEGYYTLSDFWEPKEWPKEKKKRMEGYYQLGKLLGCLHSYFAELESSKYGDLRKKGMFSRVRFQQIYEYFSKISADLKNKFSKETASFLKSNLPSISERVHRSESFYEKCKEIDIFSFPQLPLDALVYHQDRWYLTGIHVPYVVPIHEDTYAFIIQIFHQEQKELKGVKAFLSGYLTERELPRKEWDYIFAMSVFPWGILDHLYSLFQKRNQKEITLEQITPIFARQMEQESVLEFLAQWADLRGRVSY